MFVRFPVTVVVVTFATLATWQPTFAQEQFTEEQAQRIRRTAVVDVIANWKDSVVYVTGPQAVGETPTLDEFFRLPRKTKEVTNLGSGFVIHESGYIVTTAHGAERVITPQVTLDDGRRYVAELVAILRPYDLALLKIDAAETLRPVRLALADDVMLGETVIVIGNPHGLVQTCTSGIVSAVGRSTRPDGLPGVTLRHLIQTDASINPGSSGGPWFNAVGQVIGMTTSKKPESDNIGFAVPAATIRKALPAMLDVEHRYGLITGIKVKPGDPCVVAAVAKDSPASRAGLQPNDVLTKLGEHTLSTGLDFHLAMIGRKPGEQLVLHVRRADRDAQTSLVVAPRPQPDGAALLQERFGMKPVPLDDDKARATSLRVYRGVVVETVEPGLYDHLKAPPKPGDVLAQVNGIRPRDLNHLGLLLQRIPERQPAKMVLLRLNGDVATRVDLTVTPRR